MSNYKINYDNLIAFSFLYKYHIVLFLGCWLHTLLTVAQPKIKEIQCFWTYHNNGNFRHADGYVIKQRPYSTIQFTRWGDTLLYQVYNDEQPEVRVKKRFDANTKLIEEYRYLKGKSSKLTIEYFPNGTISKKVSEFGSYTNTVSLTETFHKNENRKEVIELEKKKNETKFSLLKKILYNESGKLVYKDSLHSFITALKPDGQYEHIRICDTNTVKYNGKTIRFYRKLYLNQDSILFKSVEFRGSDSLVCGYNIKGDSLVQEYISDSYYKGAKEFTAIKDYYYGLDIMRELIEDIYDVENNFSLGQHYVCDGFGRPVEFIFASNRFVFTPNSITLSDNTTKIYPIRKIEYDHYGNRIKEVFYHPQHYKDDEETLYARKGEVVRLFEYTYNLKGEIKSEKISGCIVKRVPFNDRYPNFTNS